MQSLQREELNVHNQFGSYLNSRVLSGKTLHCRAGQGLSGRDRALEAVGALRPSVSDSQRLHPPPCQESLATHHSRSHQTWLCPREQQAPQGPKLPSLTAEDKRCGEPRCIALPHLGPLEDHLNVSLILFPALASVLLNNLFSHELVFRAAADLCPRPAGTSELSRRRLALRIQLGQAPSSASAYLNTLLRANDLPLHTGLHCNALHAWFGAALRQ